MPKMSKLFFTSETRNSRNVEIGTNIAHDVRMMPELFALKLCTALIHKKTAKNRPKCAALW